VYLGGKTLAIGGQLLQNSVKCCQYTLLASFLYNYRTVEIPNKLLFIARPSSAARRGQTELP
jgi:hypothetical protein